MYFFHVLSLRLLQLSPDDPEGGGFSQMNSNTNKNNARIGIPVPWVYTIGYLVGIGIQFVVPVSIASSAALVIIVRVLGILLVAAGAVLMAWSLSIFHKHHTTTVPTETTTTFVNWGPYRFSRNPMYVGLFLFFAGLSVIFAFVWPILALLAVVYYVNSKVIPIEERQLRKNFGEVYEQYCKKVRRWI